MTLRTEKVAALIQQELGSLMNKLELPFLTTISKVEVTPDLKWAKVWITVFSDKLEHEEKVLKDLSQNMYDLQGELNSKLKMKIRPRIKFELDHSQQYASHINKLLKDANNSTD